jgi:hypothetical protein
MALVLKDRVKETTSTQGTGTLTLLGAVQGYQAFSAIGNGNTTYYCIQGTVDWEVGIGTVGSGTLTRDTVLASSNNGNFVGFGAGVKDVFCTYPAGKSVSTDSLPVTGEINGASPNATVNVASLTAAVTTATGDIALVPKGTGAKLAQVPDGTTTGGNKRGTYAVDWQTVRTGATQVASGSLAVIGGGYGNISSATNSTVAGGSLCQATQTGATVGGGGGNVATSFYSTVAGGADNNASATHTTIAGGRFNTASTEYSTVAGGRQNAASGAYSSVGGGLSNASSNQYTTISGGRLNAASAIYGSVGGGISNTSSGQYATISGGSSNTGSGDYSAIGGGQSNSATSSTAVVSGGSSNTASGTFSNVSGGISNTASGSRSAVLSGSTNLADGQYSVILGGIYGTARQMIGYAAQSGANPFTGTTVGMVQTGSMLLGMVTTNNSSKTMSSDGLSAGFTRNVLTLQDNSAIFFKGSVIANVTGAGDTKSWTFEGQIKRGSGASTTVLTGSTVTVGYEDTGASAWTLSLAANTTDGSLRVSGVGAVSDTVRWVCKLETTEVGF